MPRIDDDKMKLVRRETMATAKRFAKHVAMRIEQNKEAVRLRQQQDAAAAPERTEATPPQE
jgi:hypothetical protein